jgi:hypothetical protein
MNRGTWTYLAPLLVLGGLAACGGDDPLGPAGPGDPTPLDVERVAGRVGVAVLGVAVADDGAGPFDNAVPCPRRGVIDFSNTPTGRLATFSGCDVGDGLVVDGSGAIDWVGPGLEETRDQFCQVFAEPGCATRFVWTGVLEVREASSTMPAVAFVLDGFRAEDIALTLGGVPFPDWMDLQTGGLGFESMNVLTDGAEIPVDDPELPRSVFDISTLGLGAIPNPSNSLDALTEADVKRLAYHTGMAIAFFLSDETFEVGRGEHTHQGVCGFSGVMFDPETSLPTITNQWTRCPAGGVILDGTFVTILAELSESPGRLAVQIDGPLRIGGGVPDVTLSAWTWIMDGLPDLPGPARLSGTLRTASGAVRSYDFELILDD